MAELLKGRIVWLRKEDEVASRIIARGVCEGLEGRAAWIEQAETAQAVVATAAAVRATVRGGSPTAEKSVPRGDLDEAVDLLHDLNPHFLEGPGRKLGL